MAVLCALVTVVTAGAPVWRAMPAEPDMTGPDQHAIVAQVEKSHELIEDVRHGQNISQTRMGLFVVGLIGKICEYDRELYEYFHKNNYFIESYLINTFQYSLCQIK